MAAFHIDYRDGIFYLTGRIEAGSRFDRISVPGLDGLALNCAGIELINSVGVIEFGKFVDTWGGRKVEYHECSIEFLTALTIVPSLLGPGINTAQVKSFYCHYFCASCGAEAKVLVHAGQLKQDGTRLIFPNRPCGACGVTSHVDANAEEVADLCMLGALRVGA